MTPTEHTFLKSLLHEYGIAALLQELADELATPPVRTTEAAPVFLTKRRGRPPKRLQAVKRPKGQRRWLRLPPDIITQVKTMLAGGASKTQIAKRLDINESSVTRVQKRIGREKD